MSVSDFGQARSTRLDPVFRKALDREEVGTADSRLPRILFYAWISKKKAHTEGSCAACKEKSYEMNKCLSLVHLTSTLKIQSGTFSKGRNLVLLSSQRPAAPAGYGANAASAHY
jgi:hypothetical protein